MLLDLAQYRCFISIFISLLYLFDVVLLFTPPAAAYYTGFENSRSKSVTGGENVLYLVLVLYIQCYFKTREYNFSRVFHMYRICLSKKTQTRRASNWQMRGQTERQKSERYMYI